MDIIIIIILHLIMIFSNFTSISFKHYLIMNLIGTKYNFLIKQYLKFIKSYIKVILMLFLLIIIQL